MFIPRWNTKDGGKNVHTLIRESTGQQNRILFSFRQMLLDGKIIVPSFFGFLLFETIILFPLREKEKKQILRFSILLPFSLSSLRLSDWSYENDGMKYLTLTLSNKK